MAAGIGFAGREDVGGRQLTEMLLEQRQDRLPRRVAHDDHRRVVRPQPVTLEAEQVLACQAAIADSVPEPENGIA